MQMAIKPLLSEIMVGFSLISCFSVATDSWEHLSMRYPTNIMLPCTKCKWWFFWHRYNMARNITGICYLWEQNDHCKMSNYWSRCYQEWDHQIFF